MGQKIFALLLLMLFSSASYSELVIRVTQGNDKPTKIAIAPIDQTGIQTSEDISRIVELDLQRSGLFETIERRDMLAFPGRAQMFTTETGDCSAPSIWLLENCDQWVRAVMN